MSQGPEVARYVVLKFGGTSVSSKSRWQTIARLVRERRDQGLRVVVVVSALSGVTNALEQLIETAATGGDAQGQAAAIADRHLRFVDELGLAGAPGLGEWLARLAALAGDPRAPSRDFAWQAEVLAIGELLSSTLGAHVLEAAGLPAEWLDAREWLHAMTLPNQSPWAARLSVSCRCDPDPEMRQSLARRSPVLITQGFIARHPDGGTAILGRGGSDTSAAYFGALLGAEAVEIWTDVAGMFSANPRIVPQARLLRRLDYEEAQEIATTGAKVLHPRCLSPVREAGVPLWIKDTNRPELEGTRVGPRERETERPGVKAISARTGITLVSMESVGMYQQVGFLADVFAIFKRHGLSIDLIGSAETNVTVSLDPIENLVNSNVIEALCRDLEPICRVKVIAPCAAITMVGRGMRSLLATLSPVLAEFGRETVHLISQSSNDLNLTFVVAEARADLVPALHALLVRAGAMRLNDETCFGPTWAELYAPSEPRAATGPWWVERRDELLARMAHADGPRYVYDLSVVRARAAALKAAVPAVDRWYYAMKANAHPAVLRTVAEAGFGIECVSWAEVEAADAALPGLPGDQVLFTPNFAPRREYERALARGARVTVDALHPLAEWSPLFVGREIVLRVDPGYGSGHHQKVITGGDESKFGVALADLSEVRRLARAAGCRIVALHAHLGSGIAEVATFRELYAWLAALAEDFPDVTRINIGGGLAVRYRDDDAALDLAALGAALAEVKRHYPQYRLWMEPGRFLVAEAGVLLARVTQVKRKAGRIWVGLETGMNSLIRPSLYEAWHEIRNLSRLDAPADTVCEVVGPICESGDVLGLNRRLPEPREGDVVLIATTGAYGAVMASRYNLREPAAEVVL
jgi:diaminopimelate decarboxylase/aspartate kinase